MLELATKKIVLASSNKGKLKEIQHLLQTTDWQLLPQDQLNVAAPEETQFSFVENAILKARHAAALTGLPAIADDSGLEVNVLQGAPGIYSARYAGENATDAENVAKLLHALATVEGPQRTAQFQCVMVLMRHAKDPSPIICQGTWKGRILFEPRGELGFGYDPIFYVPTHDCSAAQLPLTIKNKISHRGQALQQLLQYLQ